MRKVMVFLVFGLFLVVLGEEVKVVPKRFVQREGKNVVDMYYDLPEGFYGDVHVLYRVPGKPWKRAKGVSGAVGEVKGGKNLHIVWNLEVDFPVEFEGDVDVVVRVTRGLKYIGRNSQGYKEYKNLKDGSILIYIPPGEFIMGSPEGEGDSDEHPQHRVYLDGYFIGKYEVTVAQFRKFCEETGYKMPEQPSWNKDNHPVVNVTWEDAVAYCKWAGLRLPTEAEWEKAARGTDGRKYPWGNHEPYYNGRYYANYDPGNYSEDGYKYTAPVGSYPHGASPYGCMDMAGNVWEWCYDWYDEDYYKNSPYRNPKGPSSGTKRVCRGGSWCSSARYVRCAYRDRDSPSNWWDIQGFRPAR